MATDFRSQRIRTNALIVSRSDAGNASFIIYSGSSATNSTGGISDANMFSGVGKDVFLFVSGTKTDESTGATRGSKNTSVTLFGGDIVVSGTLYADRQVIEVDEAVTGSLSVSGSLFVSGSGVIKNGLTVQLDTGAEGGTISGSIHQTDGGLSYLVAGENITISSASNGQVTINGSATAGFSEIYWKSPQNTYLNATGSVYFAGGDGDTAVTSNIGSDVFFYVSGSRNSAGSDQNIAVFGGDVVLSGTQTIQGFTSVGAGHPLGDMRLENYGVALSPAGEGSAVQFRKARGTITAPTAIQDGDGLGDVIFQGYQNAEFQNAATIRGLADGTPAGDFVPGKIEFKTGTDAALPATRVVIRSDGKVGIGTETPGAELGVRGVVSASLGYSGSLTRLTDGRSYLVAGSGVTISSGSGNDQITISSTSAANPGGSSPQVQFNDAGSFGGISGVTSDGTSMTFGDTAIYVGQDIIHTGDDDTKITFGDDAIGFTVGNEQLLTISEAGQDIVTVGDGGDVDFQVRTDNNNNTIYVRGDNDRVGIGTGDPDSILHVEGTAPTVSIQRNDNSDDSTIAFLGSGGNTGAIAHLGNTNDLVFKTHNGSSPEEMLRLGSHYGVLNRQVILLSGSSMAASAMQPKEAADINFFVSGAIDSQGSSIRGTGVFGGDLIVSGGMKVMNGSSLHGGTISGSIHHTNHGTSYLVAGNNVSIASSSNGQVTISASGGGSAVGTVGQVQLSDGSGALSGSDGLWWGGGGTGSGAQDRGFHVSGTIHVHSDGTPGTGIQFDTGVGQVPSIYATNNILYIDGDDYTVINADFFTATNSGFWANRVGEDTYGDFSVTTGNATDGRRLGLALDSDTNQMVLLGGTTATLTANTGLHQKMYTDYTQGNGGTTMPDDIGVFISGSILGKGNTTPQYQGWRGVTTVGGDLHVSGTIFLQDLVNLVGQARIDAHTPQEAGFMLYGKRDSGSPSVDLFMKRGTSEINLSNQMSGSIRSQKYDYPNWHMTPHNMKADIGTLSHLDSSAGMVAKLLQYTSENVYGVVVSAQIPENCTETSGVYFTVYVTTNTQSGGSVDIVMGAAGRANGQGAQISSAKTNTTAGCWLDSSLANSNMATGWQPFASQKDGNGYWSTTLQSANSGDFQWFSSQIYQLQDLVNSGDLAAGYVPLNPGDVVDFAIGRHEDNISGGLGAGELYLKWVQVNWIP